MPKDYMTMREAQEYLGISKVKISKLVKEGTLKTKGNPLDSRVKLVKREDVEKLKSIS